MIGAHMTADLLDDLVVGVGAGDESTLAGDLF